MLFRTVAVLILIFGLNSMTESANSKTKTIPYNYVLDADEHVLSGHIAHDAKKGAKVRADTLVDTEGGHEGSEAKEKYLKVIITQTTTQKLQTTPLAGRITMARPLTQDHPTTSSHNEQKHTSASTGNHRSAQDTTITRSAELFTNEIPTTESRTNRVKVVTTNAARENTIPLASRAHNVRVLNEPARPEAVHDMPSDFLPVHQHHSIHITHLAKDSVHPVANRRRRNIEQQTEFAVPPEHFQPDHLRAVSHVQQPAIVIMDSDTFYVDPTDFYIKVNHTEELEDESVHVIEFYVYLADENGVAISNPLPFMVYVDRPEVESSSYPAVPAVFAGVLVLFVIFFAVAIPLVTRAKRRYKEGKPMFKLGSHPSRADLENIEEEKRANSMSRKPSEPNWYGNNYFYTYDEEVAKERSDFTTDLKHYTEPAKPPTLQLTKKVKEPLSEKSSSSGVDVSSQGGAEGVNGEDTYSQRL
ncbi:hypothetical protein ACF0H5_019829 [Mactra antiquata]